MVHGLDHERTPAPASLGLQCIATRLRPLAILRATRLHLRPAEECNARHLRNVLKTVDAEGRGVKINSIIRRRVRLDHVMQRQAEVKVCEWGHRLRCGGSDLSVGIRVMNDQPRLLTNSHVSNALIPARDYGASAKDESEIAGSIEYGPVAGEPSHIRYAYDVTRLCSSCTSVRDSYSLQQVALPRELLSIDAYDHQGVT
mmetsp:Transcript_72199/g.211552  ORF Transcript_72199/g.211552 Transcript_72199/m.211552 type:complete len:200 (-) Transcript_72199:868-1467(-)